MATIQWTGKVNNDFNTTGNWSTNTIPVGADDAVISIAAAVNTSQSDTVNTLAMVPTASLSLSANAGLTFTIGNGSGTGGLAGTINIGNSDALTISGNIVNSGKINENSTGSSTFIVIGNAGVMLSGGGQVNLSNSSANFITGQSPAATLTNVDNTIAGAGNIGNGQMTLVNQAKGTINANQATALILNTGGNTITNSGLLEDTGTGGLIIQSVVNNVGGKILASGAGATVVLQNTIIGGTLTTTSGGIIQSSASGAGSALDGLPLHPVAISAGSTVQVVNGTSLSLAGSIVDNGTISLLSTGSNTDLRIVSPIVTVSGGSISLGNNVNNRIFGNNGSFQLVNSSTIAGAGQLGAGSLTFVNKNLVNANQATALILNTGNNIVVNTKTLESTSAGGLVVQSTNEVNNTGGTLLANGDTAHVDLTESTIGGGTLATASGGVIQTITGHSATLDGLNYGTLNNTGLFVVNDSSTLTLAGAINNTGAITENANTDTTNIRIGSQFVTLQGGGTLTMTNDPNNQIFGNNGVFQLINADNTISGSGQIGGGSMTLINQAKGVINANQAATFDVPGYILLNTGGNISYNFGLLEATNAGGLVIQNSTIDSTGGMLQANGAGAHLDLLNSKIEGGALATASGGVIQTITGNGATLDGLTDGAVTAAAGTSLVINDNSTLALAGMINNAGTIAINATGVNNTSLIVGSQVVTLQGGGSVTMLNNDAANRIAASNGVFQLVNVDNKISGAGRVGDGSMVLNNKTAGVINANLSAALTINTGGNISFNAGLIEATNTVGPNGGLIILNSTIDNKGGTISAAGNNTHVDLQGGTVIEGGTLSTTGTGLIRTITGSTAVLDGLTDGPLTIAAGSTVRVSDRSGLFLAGTIANNGTIVENAVSLVANTTIRLASPVVTLTGTGSILMANNNLNNQIFGNNNVFQLNNLSNTISGAGQLGAGGMELSNSGTISATQSSALVLNMGGSGNSVNNASGKMFGKGSGGLILTNAIFTNNGTVEADNGSFVTYQSGAINTNLAEGVLSGGIWRAVASGGGATLSLTGGPVAVDAATVVLSGAGSVFQAGDGNTFTTLETSLKTINTGAQLQVLDNRGFTTANTLTDNGTLQLAGGIFHAGSLNIGAGAQLFGFGTVQDSPINNGTIRASGLGTTLSVSGAVGGTGTLQSDTGATLLLNAAGNKVKTAVDNGVFTLAAGAGLTVTGSVNPAGAGTFQLNTSAILDIAADTGASNKVKFLGAAKLVIEAAAQWGTGVGTGSYAGPTIQSFVSGDTIDLRDYAFTGVSTTGTYDPTTGLLQITNGTTLATLDFDNATLGIGTFTFSNDGTGHTFVTLAAAPAAPAAVSSASTTTSKALLPDPTWTGFAGDNNFNTASNWDTNTVPVSGDAVVINLSGAAVNSNTGNTIAALAMAATTSLSVNSSTFSITGGSGAGGLAGTINVNNATALFLGGTFTNSGIIAENSTGNTTEILINAPTVTLQGAGKINLSNSPGNFIFGLSASNTLVNAGNTISGAGNIGNGQMTLINQAAGIINANQTNTLVLNTGGNTITNAGTLEDVGGTGGLVIQSAVSDVGGKIIASGAGATVVLQNTVSGGTLTTTSGGTIQASAAGGGVLDGLPLHAVTISGGSTVQASNTATLSLAGMIINNGTISVTSTGNTTSLVVASPLVTLSPATGATGKVVLSDNSNNRIVGNNAGFHLINSSTDTISGAGQLGAGSLTLINNGTINATGITNALIVNTGNDIVVNTKVVGAAGGGILQSSSAGGLQIQNTNEVNNSGGTIQALVAGSHVDLMETMIAGGTLTTANGGVVQTITGHSATLDGLNFGTLTISAGSKVMVNDNSTLALAGVINNAGTIALNATGVNNTNLIVGSQVVTLQGGGSVTMLNNDTANRIAASNGVFQLVNVDNKISGAGRVGDGSMVLNNKTAGVINANSTAALTINTGGFLSFNTGLMESTSSGGLVFQNMTLANAAGTVSAPLAGSHVDVVDATIAGGTLTTASTGVVQTITGHSATLDGLNFGTLTISAGSKVMVNDNSTLALAGVINNAGTIAINATGASNTNLIVGSQVVTLQGGGSVTMLNNDAANRIAASNGVFQLVNVDNKISGAGRVGDGSMVLNNKTAGVINANSTAALTINTGGNISYNSGLLEATNTTAGNGGLIITNSTIDNAGGIIKAVGLNARVDLTGGTVIEGGTLTTATSGIIDAANTPFGNSATLDGLTAGALTITAASSLVVNNSTFLSLAGTITNNGTISETAGVNNADIHIASPVVTLAGTGSLVMSNSGNNRIFGNNNVFQLNNLSNTISGAGQLGAGGMELSNSGTISATQSTALTVSLGFNNSINNVGGTMKAAAGGTGGLILTNGIYTNLGTMEADNGNSATYSTSGGTVMNTNNAEGVLSGGTWKAVSAGGGATLSIAGGAVVTDAATIVVSGVGSVFQAGDNNSFTPLETSLTTIAAGGQLQVLGARGYTTSNAITDNGTLQLGSGTFHAGALTVGAGGRVFGFGTVQNAAANSGTIEALGGTLILTGAAKGAGTLQADAGATLTLNVGGNTAGTVTDNGTINLNGTGNTATTVTNNGSLNLAASASLIITGSVAAASTGTFTLNTSSVLDIAADSGVSNKINFAGTGILDIEHAAQWGANVGLSTYAGPLIQSFGVGDKFDFEDVGFVANTTTSSYDPTTGRLQITGGSTPASLLFDNATLGGTTFSVTNDGTGHTLVMRS